MLTAEASKPEKPGAGNCTPGSVRGLMGDCQSYRNGARRFSQMSNCTKYILGFTLILLAAWPLSAKNLRWREMRGKKLITFDWNCSQTRLFPNKVLSKVVRKAIASEDIGRPETYGDRAFTTKLLNSGQTVYFIPLVCGATGNCTWRIYTINPIKYLGQVSGQYLYTYQSPTDWPEIVTYTHMSAAEGILATYKLHQGRYKWVGDEYRVDYQGLSGHQMPKFLEKAQQMCKKYGE